MGANASSRRPPPQQLRGSSRDDVRRSSPAALDAAIARANALLSRHGLRGARFALVKNGTQEGEERGGTAQQAGDASSGSVETSSSQKGTALWRMLVTVRLDVPPSEEGGAYEGKNLNLRQFYHFFKQLEDGAELIEADARRKQAAKESQSPSGDGSLGTSAPDQLGVTSHQLLVDLVKSVGPTNAETDEDLECPVCMENMQDVLLDCHHGFCKDCITRWREGQAENASLCPVCRTNVAKTDDDWVLMESADADVEHFLEEILRTAVS
jgi:Zinc finger, C3HC4 type (RING finger)